MRFLALGKVEKKLFVNLECYDLAIYTMSKFSEYLDIQIVLKYFTLNKFSLENIHLLLLRAI